MEDLTMFELLDKWMDQESIHRLEGETGTRNLAKIARAIGYKDSMYFGQFQGGCYGDLLEFFNDNPGAIQAVVEWIEEHEFPEWKENVKEQLNEDPEEEEEEDD